MTRRGPGARSAPPTVGVRSGPPRSVWIGLVTLVLLAPTAARSPQTGDGAEIVATALRGGVLHPPGFPLQAWIDRALVRAPGLEPAHGLSLFGLVCHAAAAGAIAEILWWLGVTALCSWVLLRTPFGNWIFAVGGDETAARNVGVSS